MHDIRYDLGIVWHRSVLWKIIRFLNMKLLIAIYLHVSIMHISTVGMLRKSTFFILGANRLTQSWCTNHQTAFFIRHVLMCAFDFLKSTRVGEASNPGPVSQGRHQKPSQLKCLCHESNGFAEQNRASFGAGG